ncbi:hypothetical protein PAHAL_7G286600 [Panicum hallii]|uniref:FORGETTER1 first zinc ribbon domain-containing protein n=1 Tax=Panicum hallii TaxID=206008 RepID=A0A2S3IA70_9POAL|nr:uncharacterized protein LOC112901347 [Panicum hallii]PAN40029.1 hypothetical protein PAHAL_7G286600 [Panicum hallii]
MRCAGCGETLEVESDLTEFACPNCGNHQALPPELMPRHPRSPGTAHGQGRFACLLCGSELAAFPAAAISVVAPPAAVPITPRLPADWRSPLRQRGKLCRGKPYPV